MARTHPPFFRLEWREGGAILAVEGDLDMATVHLLLAEIGEDRNHLTLDLTALRFIDSIGIRTMLELDEGIDQFRILTTEQSQFIRLIRLVHLDEALPVTIKDRPPEG